MWHYAISRMVVAARANGLRPVDGPFGDFSDTDGYIAAAKRAAVLGCDEEQLQSQQETNQTKRFDLVFTRLP
jgi:citrate lyase beta subunit